ncbi:hypothetical protein P280DRAFT_457746 [Massarina eburnea CBS 473.64]|uniref:Uncharacterized protein n=1 Tax=Massarina eburnea CBS 473.64 TaxID=1395130 RepID=A0A6A6RQA9_9PLEO|nr:hypothetical protein P280DRAFT_457746 [Massarina eburnea CBS 473.64]
MRVDLTCLALVASANAFAIAPRDEDGGIIPRGEDGWHPQTKTPHFFNLKVNDRCDELADPPETEYAQCPFAGYALRLEKGIVVATPYNKWWDPKLPTFFVDSDTQLYTVSKNPLQIYIDDVTGAVKYTEVGWLPPSSTATGFFHTGNNPLQLVDPSPSYLTWPATAGIAFDGYWAFCPLGETGQYQLFTNNRNFDPQGVQKDECRYRALAAVNANPWKKAPSPPHHGGGPPPYDHDGPGEYPDDSDTETGTDGADTDGYTFEDGEDGTEG